MKQMGAGLAKAGAGLAALALAALATGCSAAGTDPAALEAKAKEATAAAIGGVAPDVIQVANLTMSPAKATWEATASGATYVCTADETFARPDCQQAAG